MKMTMVNLGLKGLNTYFIPNNCELTFLYHIRTIIIVLSSERLPLYPPLSHVSKCHLIQNGVIFFNPLTAKLFHPLEVVSR